MPDFVNRLVFSLAGIQSVRSIENNSVFKAHILIRVNYPRGDYQRCRSIRPAEERLSFPVSRRVLACIPEVDLEVCRSDKAEIVRLLNMFMRSTCDAGYRHGDIGHLRPEPFGELIAAKHLGKPPSFVKKLGKRFY